MPAAGAAADRTHHSAQERGRRAQRAQGTLGGDQRRVNDARPIAGEPNDILFSDFGFVRTCPTRSEARGLSATHYIGTACGVVRPTTGPLRHRY